MAHFLEHLLSNNSKILLMILNPSIAHALQCPSTPTVQSSGIVDLWSLNTSQLHELGHIGNQKPFDWCDHSRAIGLAHRLLENFSAGLKRNPEASLVYLSQESYSEPLSAFTRSELGKLLPYHAYDPSPCSGFSGVIDRVQRYLGLPSYLRPAAANIAAMPINLIAGWIMLADLNGSPSAFSQYFQDLGIRLVYDILGDEPVFRSGLTASSTDLLLEQFIPFRKYGEGELLERYIKKGIQTLVVKKNNVPPYVILNTHFTGGNSDIAERQRADELLMLGKVLGDIQSLPPQLHIIVAGDFNIPDPKFSSATNSVRRSKQENEFQRLMKFTRSFGLRDADPDRTVPTFDADRLTSGKIGLGGKDGEGKCRIDYIFVSEGLRVDSFEVDDLVIPIYGPTPDHPSVLTPEAAQSVFEPSVVVPASDHSAVHVRLVR